MVHVGELMSFQRILNAFCALTSIELLFKHLFLPLVGGVNRGEYCYFSASYIKIGHFQS